MARSKSFFGLRTGSTKSLTFQVYRGEQITKDRVSRVSNPQSDAQMQQRLLIPMVAQCRSMLSGLIDHSFEGVPYGYQSLQHFSTLNLRKGALTVWSWVPKGAKDPGSANYIISTGSLLELHCSDNGWAGKYFGQSCDELNLPVMTAHAEMAKGDTIPADWYDAFLAANPTLQKGDQLTLLEQVKTSTYNVGEIEGPTMGFFIARLILDSANADMAKFKFVENNGNHAYFSDGNMKVSLFVTSNKAFTKNLLFTTLDFALVKGHQKGMAVILSRLVNNKWKRSITRLSGDGYEDGVSYEQALSTYVKSGSASAKYLNQGREGTGIA